MQCADPGLIPNLPWNGADPPWILNLPWTARIQAGIRILHGLRVSNPDSIIYPDTHVTTHFSFHLHVFEMIVLLSSYNMTFAS